MQPDYFLIGERDRRRLRRVGLRVPPQHNSDHRAMVTRLKMGKVGKLAAYRKKRRRFPLNINQHRPLTETETLFEDLKATVGPVPARERPSTSWISPETWALVDQRALLRRTGRLNKRDSRRLAR